MGLALTARDSEGEELDGFAVGHYSDFGCFRDTVGLHLDAAQLPLLMGHSDCDGEWTAEELPRLMAELDTVAATFERLPPEEPRGAFEHVAHCRKGATNLHECFHTVDEEILVDALKRLCAVAAEAGGSITFD